MTEPKTYTIRYGGPALLAPGAPLSLPALAFTASTGDLDDIANQLHRHQRRYVVPRVTAKLPSWNSSSSTRFISAQSANIG